MDLTVPYTFYPIALPRWSAWTLFGLALLGGVRSEWDEGWEGAG